MSDLGSFSALTPQIGQALLEGDDFFRSLVDALPAAIYTTDIDGRITYFNEAAAILWGRRPELGGSEWCGSWRLFWPDGRALPHDQCPMAVAVKEKRNIRGVEAIAERPDGTRTSFLPFPTPIYNASGEFIGAVNMLVDITDRKHAEEAAQHLASIVESADDAIISKNLDGIITSWNFASERLFGYLAEEIIGKSVRILIPANLQDEEDRIIERIRRGQRIEHYETVRQRKHGSLINVSLTVSPIKSANGKIVGASKIVRDITDRKRTEAQLSSLAREAEHRTKNVLATVQAAVHLTEADTPEAMKLAIEGRIHALAKVHSLFVATQWSGAELHSLVEQELAPYLSEGKERATIAGPEVLLPPSMAEAVGVVVHELATNAAKYGALSVAEGQISIAWAFSSGGQLVLRWIETKGPAANPPSRRGFGIRVAEKLIRNQPSGTIRFDWPPQGLHCEMTLAVPRERTAMLDSGL
jgi:two-component system CheB/CheR fusion protein